MREKLIGWEILLIAVCLKMTWQDDLTANCTEPWFGENCTFLCQCTGAVQCDLATGECPPNVTCTAGTFGPGCQFNNSMTEFGLGGNQSFLSDLNLRSCNPLQRSTSLTVTMRAPIYVTWIRIHTDIDMSNHDLQVQLETDPCLNRSLYRVSNTTLDVTCEPNVRTQLISLKGAAVGRMCQIEINGGRNVAMKQKTLQSSFYDPVNSPVHLIDSGLAVDGSKIFNTLGQSCIQTDMILGDAYWSLEYKWPQKIARVLIYNNNDSPADLEGFFLELHDMRLTNNTKEFSYKDDDPAQSKAVYDIQIIPCIKQVTFVKIGVVERSKTVLRSNVLAFCEVETYGETICPQGMFGIDCQGTCQCGLQERCHTVTGLCAAPCVTDKPGQSCTYPCHPNCIHQRCQGPDCVFCVASDCLRCKPGFLGTYCDEGCPKGTHGDNCTLSCSKNCSGSTCNATNGHCLSCAGNQVMPLCTEEQDNSGSEKFEELTWHYLILLILLVPILILLICCFLKRRSPPVVAETAPEAKRGL